MKDRIRSISRGKGPEQAPPSKALLRSNPDPGYHANSQEGKEECTPVAGSITWRSYPGKGRPHDPTVPPYPSSVLSTAYRVAPYPISRSKYCIVA
eukprot:2368233-Rhodomonas_salina.1